MYKEDNKYLFPNNSSKIKIKKFNNILSNKIINEDFPKNKFNLYGSIYKKLFFKFEVDSFKEYLSPNNKFKICFYKRNNYFKLNNWGLNSHLDLGLFEEKIFDKKYFVNPYFKIFFPYKFKYLNFGYGRIITFKNFTNHYFLNFKSKEKYLEIESNVFLKKGSMNINFYHLFTLKNRLIPSEKRFQLNYNYKDNYEITLQGFKKVHIDFLDYNFNKYIARFFVKNDCYGDRVFELNYEDNIKLKIGYEKKINNYLFKAHINNESDIKILFSQMDKFYFSLSSKLSDLFNNLDFRIKFNIN